MYKIPKLDKIFSHKKSLKSYHSYVIMRPNANWKLIISIAFFIILILLVMSFYLLNLVQQEDAFKVERIQNENGSLINQNLLDQTLKYFEGKSKKFDGFTIKPPFDVDPL